MYFHDGFSHLADFVCATNLINVSHNITARVYVYILLLFNGRNEYKLPALMFTFELLPCGLFDGVMNFWHMM